MSLIEKCRRANERAKLDRWQKPAIDMIFRERMSRSDLDDLALIASLLIVE